MDKAEIKEQSRLLMEEIDKRLGVKPTQLAKMIGVSASTINRSVNDPSYSAISAKTLGRISAWLDRDAFKAGHQPEDIANLQAMTTMLIGVTSGASRAELLKATAMGELPPPDEAPLGVRGLARGLRDRNGDLPLIGTAAGSLMGSMQLDNETQPRCLHRPAGLLNSPRAYALIITGNSMAPKFVDGDLVFVDPDKRVDVGDVVVIHTKNYNNKINKPVQAYLKYFRGILDNKLFAEQLNPAAKIDFNIRTDNDDEEIVHAFHRVVSTRELFGL